MTDLTQRSAGLGSGIILKVWRNSLFSERARNGYMIGYLQTKVKEVAKTMARQGEQAI